MRKFLAIRDFGLIKDCIALLSGASLPFAFAPFHHFYLAILAPAILLWSWLQASPGRAAWRGFLFGLSFFGLGISWVFISIHVYSNTPLFIAVLITAFLIMFLAAYIALQGYLMRRFFNQNNSNDLLLAFPVLWVLLEWLRGWVLTGFPWLFLGYSQIDTLLGNFAPIGSVYLVSFVVALNAGLIIYGITKRHFTIIYSIAGLFLIWCLGGAFGSIHWTTKESTPLPVALVQGNIPQSLRWDPAQVNHTLNVYKQLTNTAWQNRIIVWPEAAIPLWLDQATNYLNYFDQLASQKHIAFVTGIPVRSENNQEFFNSMIGLGSAIGQYDKRHLVPFGEYVPLENLLRGLINFFNLPMSNFSSGAEIQSGIAMFGFNVATYICYEIAYPEEFFNQFPSSKLIITISDDAWFGDSWAPAQQLEISQMRSLETGRYQLASTNDGLTAIISPRGKIISQFPQFKTGILTGNVYAMAGQTPIIAIGTTPVIFIFFVLLGIAFLYRPEILPKNK